MVFGFLNAGRVVEIESNNEKQALLKYIEKYWDIINEDKPIELLGERTYSGPGEEDGPWADGWEERSGIK
ncbi:MAG: hypothetical protein ACOC22_03495 [bacterium]